MNCTTSRSGRTPIKSSPGGSKTSPAAKLAWKSSRAMAKKMQPIGDDWDCDKENDIHSGKFKQMIDSYKTKLNQEDLERFEFAEKNHERKEFDLDAFKTQETLENKITSDDIVQEKDDSDRMDASSSEEAQAPKRDYDEIHMSLVRGQPLMRNRDREEDDKTKFDVVIKAKDLEHARAQFEDMEKMLKAAQGYHSKELKDALTYQTLLVRNGAVQITAQGLNSAQHLAMFATQEGYRQGARFHLRVRVPSTMYSDNLLESAPKILESMFVKNKICGEINAYSSTSNGSLFCYADVEFMMGVAGLLEENPLKLKALEGSVDVLFDVKKAMAFVENAKLIWGPLPDDFEDFVDEVVRLNIN